MRRYHILRFDVWLCLAISFGIALLVGNVFENVLTNKYAEYKEEKKVEPNEVGGVALDNIFRAQSVDDLLEHDVLQLFLLVLSIEIGELDILRDIIYMQ